MGHRPGALDVELLAGAAALVAVWIPNRRHGPGEIQAGDWVAGVVGRDDEREARRGVRGPRGRRREAPAHRRGDLVVTDVRRSPTLLVARRGRRERDRDAPVANPAARAGGRFDGGLEIRELVAADTGRGTGCRPGLVEAARPMRGHAVVRAIAGATAAAVGDSAPAACPSAELVQHRGRAVGSVRHDPAGVAASFDVGQGRAGRYKDKTRPHGGEQDAQRAIHEPFSWFERIAVHGSNRATAHSNHRAQPEERAPSGFRR